MDSPQRGHPMSSPAASELLRTIVARMADGVVVVASDGTVRFANPAAEQLFGRSAAELVGTPLGFPVGRDETQEIDVLRPAEGAGAARLEPRAVELRTVDAVWDGEAVTLVSLRDVTERNAAQERERRLAEAEAGRVAAERSAALLRAVFDSIPDALYARDLQRITAANDPALAQLGVESLDELPAESGETPSLATALDARDPLTGRAIAAHEEPLARALQEGRMVERDLLIRDRGTNEDRIVHASAAPVHDADERIQGAVVIHRDVTLDRQRSAEREQLLTAAEAANRAKSEFLAVMSHELRTPLNAIGGYAELLELGVRGELSDAQRHDIVRIQQSQRHLLELIDEVLDLARADAGELRVDTALYRTGDTVDAALALVRPQAAGRAIVLAERECEAMERPYIGDEPRVRQVLVNLLANAVKFTPAGGRITVSCLLTDATPRGTQLVAGVPYVAIQVADTGVGIPADQLRRIFEPFTQAEGGLTRTRDGTGLGLTISRRLARLMGGDLAVESTVGVGSTFTLYLRTPDCRAQRRATSSDGGAERRTPPEGLAIAARNLARVGDLLMAEVPAIMRAWIEALRAEPDIPTASHSDRALENHAPTFVTDLALALRTMGDSEGNPAGQLRDGAAILALVAERHGAQRARLGWPETALQREYVVVEELLVAAVERIASSLTDAPSAAEAGELVRRLVGQASRRSLAGFRLATMSPVAESTPPERTRTPVDVSAD